MKKLIFPLLALSTLLLSCYNDSKEELYPTGTCNTTNVTFSGTVKPIIVQNCLTGGCHTGPTTPSGYDLTGYAGVRLAVDNGRLVGVINHSSGFSPMPQNNSKLPDCSISQITAWVNAGAPNN